MADIDRATLVVAIQTVEMALAQEEQRPEGEDDPEYLASLQRAQARLRDAYDRERQFDPKLLPWETLARAGRT